MLDKDLLLLDDLKQYVDDWLAKCRPADRPSEATV
jgi:hypothetical protein